jgi:hypothetical protein
MEIAADQAMEKAPKLWLSPLENCNCCNRDFNNTMFDARLPFGWGNYCAPCFKRNGGKLGTGLGQRYERQEIKGLGLAWVKTGG